MTDGNPRGGRRGGDPAASAARELIRGGLGTLGLKPAEALVFLALVDRADASGLTWPSQKSIGAAVGLDEKSVLRIVRRLIGAGHVELVEKGRQHKSAVYRIVAPGLGFRPAFRGGAASRLDDGSEVTLMKPLDEDPEVTRRHPKYLKLTKPGLPELARSGPARPSVSQALRAADDEETEKTSNAGAIGLPIGHPPDGGSGGDRGRLRSGDAGSGSQPQYARVESWSVALRQCVHGVVADGECGSCPGGWAVAA